MSKQLPSKDQQLITYEQPGGPRVWPRLQPLEYFLEGGHHERSGSLAGYWQILLRRRWTILAVITVFTILASIASFKMKPVYKAVARLEVEPEMPQIQMLNDSTAYQQLQTDQDFLRTQIQILQTDNLAWRTIEQLGLGQDPAFNNPKTNKPEDPETAKMQLIRRFKGQLSVDLVPGSRVVLVGFESTDPHIAARVSNALVDNYTDYNFREKYDATRQAAGRMEQQLDELKAKVEKSQRDLLDYQRQHAIVDVGEKESVVEQRLAQMSGDLSQAQNDRIEKEAQFRQVQSNPGQVSAIAQNDLLQKLQEKNADLRGQYVEALHQYGPNYPKVGRLQQEVADSEAQIKAERERVVEHIRNDYLAAKRREQLLTQAVTEQKVQLGDFNRLLIQHNLLKGEYQTNQQLYQRLLEHLKDATVSAGLRSTNVHIVDAALSPTVPVRPQKMLNISIGFLLGIVLGVLLAFIQEALDSSIKSPEEVEMLIAAPALAMIPSRTQFRERLLVSRSGEKEDHKGNVLLNFPLLQSSTSALSEAYRALRTSVLLSLASRAPQAVLVTSASAGEGKTSTAVNLALALAQCGSSVVLIDCDLRKPTIARLLETDNHHGMSTYLTGNDKIEDVMHPYPHQSNLWVIPSGPTPPNPAELVSSPLMEALVRELRGRFTHIIIDSPPLLAVTDATILSTISDGTVLVVESGVTPKKLVGRARKALDAAGARLLGVALNKVQIHHDGYSGSYYRGYYAYGAKAGK